MNKLKWLLPLLAFAPLLMAPSGGYPSFPTFLGETVNAAGVTCQYSQTPGLCINGQSSQYAAQLVGGATSGQSFGLLVDAGTTSGDVPLLIRNQSNASTFLEIQGDGGITVGPNPSDKGLGSINAQGVYSNGTALFPTVFVVSGSNTTRTSNTTLSCDANLTSATTLAVSKQYHMHAAIAWGQSTVTGNGIKMIPSVTGTGAGFSHGIFFSDNVTNSNPTTPIAQSFNGGTGVFSMTDTSVVGNVHELIIDGVFTSASSGTTTLCITWAQNTSSATATTIFQNSEMDFVEMN